LLGGCEQGLAVGKKPAPSHKAKRAYHMSNAIYQLLGDLDDVSDTTERPYKIFYTNNMGNRTFLLKMPIYDFYRMSDIANEQNIKIEKGEISQRPIDVDHANKLANYILKGLIHAAISRLNKSESNIPPAWEASLQSIGRQPYIALQPLVCNLRNCKRDGTDLKGRELRVLSNTGSEEIASHEVLLSQKHVLWVIDGQHRRKAIQFVFEFLDHVLAYNSYPNKKAIYPSTNSPVTTEEGDLWRACNEMARAHCTLAAEVHLGLNALEERQLFHDLNNLSKRVDAGLALEFDRGNPINIFIQDKLLNGILAWKVSKKDKINWQEDDGSITRKDLTSINTRLLLNRTNPRGTSPAVVEPRLPKAIDFWNAVKNIPDLGLEGAKIKTVAAQPVVLKALAKLAFDFAFGKAGKKDPNYFNKLLEGIPKVDFSHANPMWRYYQLDQAERETHNLTGLTKYLPKETTTESDYNRDIGAFDPNTGVMRFGVKHNDIYPILGDMIRWSLDLSSRQKP
jgi:hypothetical protein